MIWSISSLLRCLSSKALVPLEKDEQRGEEMEKAISLTCFFLHLQVEYLGYSLCFPCSWSCGLLWCSALSPSCRSCCVVCCPGCPPAKTLSQCCGLIAVSGHGRRGEVMEGLQHPSLRSRICSAWRR